MLDLPPTGAIGRATSRLDPSGEVEISGVPHEARTAQPPIEAGEVVVVTGFEGHRLLVCGKSDPRNRAAMADTASQRDALGEPHLPLRSLPERVEFRRSVSAGNSAAGCGLAILVAGALSFLSVLEVPVVISVAVCLFGLAGIIFGLNAVADRSPQLSFSSEGLCCHRSGVSVPWSDITDGTMAGATYDEQAVRAVWTVEYRDASGGIAKLRIDLLGLDSEPNSILLSAEFYSDGAVAMRRDYGK